MARGFSPKDFPRRAPIDRARDWQAHLADAGESNWTLANGNRVSLSNAHAAGVAHEAWSIP